MELSWLIFALVMAANTLYVGAVMMAQALDKSLPARHSIISGTNQKFLYVQDFWTMTYGDLFGIPLITNAFVHLAVRDAANLLWLLLVAALSAAIFAKICLGKSHKPDYGFPQTGKISFAGILHLFYFGMGIGAVVACLWSLFEGRLTGLVLWLAVLGAAAYAVCFAAELRSGNLDPLKRIETDQKK